MPSNLLNALKTEQKIDKDWNWILSSSPNELIQMLKLRDRETSKTVLHFLAGNNEYSELLESILRIVKDENELLTIIDLQDHDGRTPLYCAIENRVKFKTIQGLNNAGANPRLKNDEGETPLARALGMKMQAVYELLRLHVEIVKPIISQFPLANVVKPLLEALIPLGDVVPPPEAPIPLANVVEDPIPHSAFKRLCRIL